jgi:uncharacterized membrane protein
VEQQRDQAPVAADESFATSAGTSGVRLSVSSRPESPAPAPPAPDPASAPPEEQATLLGSLAPHIEPRAMAQPPQPSGQPSGQPAGAQPAPFTPPAPPLLPAVPAPAAVPAAPDAALPPAVSADQSLPPAVAPSPAVVAAPGDAAVYDRPLPPPPVWQAPAGRQPLPGHVPPAPARPAAHVPWQAAKSWGTTTITIDATTAAGASYLFWWASGLLIYFNERHNRFVRFHAMQSILLTGALTVFAVFAWIVSSLCGDVALYARDPLIRHLFGTLGWGIMVMAVVVVLFVWVPAMVAAWAGNYLRLPIVGKYAERYSAPPIEPTQPPLY